MWNKIFFFFLEVLLSVLLSALGSYRDTTVQTLTLQPSVRDGIIVYEDSPLVSVPHTILGHLSKTYSVKTIPT